VATSFSSVVPVLPGLHRLELGAVTLLDVAMEADGVLAEGLILECAETVFRGYGGFLNECVGHENLRVQQ
jgi:hypothetical protein